MLEKTIASEVTLSENPGRVLKKWREMLGVNQKTLAEALFVTPSVLSDYESGRRKSPGVEFVRRYTQALVALDLKKNGGITRKIRAASRQREQRTVFDIREFLQPMAVKDFIKHVHGKVIIDAGRIDDRIYGYTVVDSIKAILELSESEFPQIYGMNPQRAIIFTKVHMGRSPMIAIKVTKPKPSLVVFHGVSPKEVDKLAIKIAEAEKIPLAVSMTENEEKLISEPEKVEA